MCVLQMEDAFAGGYDPALELAKLHNNQKPASIIGGSQVIRKEQPMIDSIMFGEEPGHYYMLLGPKVRARMRRLPMTLE